MPECSVGTRWRGNGKRTSEEGAKRLSSTRRQQHVDEVVFKRRKGIFSKSFHIPSSHESFPDKYSFCFSVVKEIEKYFAASLTGKRAFPCSIARQTDQTDGQILHRGVTHGSSSNYPQGSYRKDFLTYTRKSLNLFSPLDLVTLIVRRTFPSGDVLCV